MTIFENPKKFLRLFYILQIHVTTDEIWFLPMLNVISAWTNWLSRKTSLFILFGDKKKNNISHCIPNYKDKLVPWSLLKGALMLILYPILNETILIFWWSWGTLLRMSKYLSFYFIEKWFIHSTWTFWPKCTYYIFIITLCNLFLTSLFNFQLAFFFQEYILKA